LQLQTAQGNKTIEVKIPAGVVTGSKIRLSAEHLLLNIKVTDCKDFELKGKNIITTTRIAPWQAALGAKVEVKTLDGLITLTIPAGTSSGQKLRLREKGMPPRKKGEKAGDILVNVMIETPANLTDEQKELYKKLKELDSR